MTKRTKERASTDVGFIFIAYNLKRIMNIVSLTQVKNKKLMTLLKNFRKEF